MDNEKSVIIYKKMADNNKDIDSFGVIRAGKREINLETEEIFWIPFSQVKEEIFNKEKTYLAGEFTIVNKNTPDALIQDCRKEENILNSIRVLTITSENFDVMMTIISKCK